MDALGPDDFLAPLCMLLVDKVAHRILRQGANEAKASLTLHISLVQHYPAPLQIHVCGLDCKLYDVLIISLGLNGDTAGSSTSLVTLNGC